jgi:hypothetical protein
MAYYFKRGFYLGYDVNDVVTFVTVSKPYPRPPDGTIDPANGRLDFGGSTIQCGDGFSTGDKQSVHRSILGNPDYSYEFVQEIDTDYGTLDVRFYIDSYRVLGMEFVGTLEYNFIDWTTTDNLLVVALHMPFYGETSSSNSIGSTKGDWESEVGAVVQVLSDPTYGTTHVYQPGAEHKFGVTYTNEGASQDDISGFLLLNFQTN